MTAKQTNFRVRLGNEDGDTIWEDLVAASTSQLALQKARQEAEVESSEVFCIQIVPEGVTLCNDPVPNGLKTFTWDGDESDDREIGGYRLQVRAGNESQAIDLALAWLNTQRESLENEQRGRLPLDEYAAWVKLVATEDAQEAKAGASQVMILDGDGEEAY